MKPYYPRLASGFTRPAGPYYSLLLILVISIFAGAAAIAATDAASNDDKEAKLVELRKQIQTLRESLESARTKKGTLQQQLRRTELEIGKLNRTIKKLETQLETKSNNLDDLHSRKTQQQHNLGEQRDSLVEQIRATFVMGKQGYLKILLNQQDPAEIGRTLTYYDYFNKARSERINTINSTLHEIDDLENTITDESARLEQLRDEQAHKKHLLEENLRSRRQIIVKLDADIDNKEQRLKQLVQDEQALAKLLEGIRNALTNIPPDNRDIQPFDTLKGSLSWPSAGSITTRFGAPRKLGQLKWQGVMIAGSEGTEVKAIYHGRVAFADWLRGYGLLLIIDHGNGYMSLYGGNQSLYKSVGDWVEAGETIATIGNSGGRLSAGLYFEIRHNGTPENPSSWCKQGKT